MGKEQSWAVCRGVYEDDEREELGREKKEKENQSLSSDMMRLAWGYLPSSPATMTSVGQKSHS